MFIPPSFARFLPVSALLPNRPIPDRSGRKRHCKTVVSGPDPTSVSGSTKRRHGNCPRPPASVENRYLCRRRIMERIVRIGDRAFVTHGNTTDAYTLLCIIAAGILRRASQRFQYGLVIRDKYIHIRQHPGLWPPGKDFLRPQK